MNRRILILITAVGASGLIFSTPDAAQKTSVDRKGVRVRIIKGPALESATNTSAVIRWTTNAGGGTIVHYGIVHYGTAPNSLNNTAKSSNRWNRNLPYMIYRVNVDRLKPGTTYYYTVGSTQANGVDDEASSAVDQFTTGP